MKRLLAFASTLAVPALLAAQSAHPASHAPSGGMTLPYKHAPRPTTANITAADLMTRLYIFADDSMMGREAGTIGNVKGTDYIAAEVKRLGLLPAGDNGTYFQTIPLKTRQIDPASALSVNGTPLAFGSEWSASGNTALSIAGAPVVFGGMIGDSVSMISPDSTAGKIVIFGVATGASPRLVRNIGRFAPGAAAVAALVPDQMLGFARRASSFVDDPSFAPRGASLPTVLIAQSAAPKLFTAPLASLKAGATGNTVAVDLKFKIDPVPFPARNVVAVLRGSDPKLAGEYVAIGAHNDHIGMNNHPVDTDSLRIFNHIVRPGGAENAGERGTPEQLARFDTAWQSYKAANPAHAMRVDSISNGADDDGSGSVSVLEIAEKLASLKGAARPKRSVIFVWHVGEEKGLLGSAYFTDHPTVPRDSIVAQLNMDMVGRGAATDVVGITKDGQVMRGGPNYLQLVGSRRLSTELGDLIEQVNTKDKHGFAFDYSMDANGHPMNIYCRSDHYEYARYGIPITFFTTGGHSDYHQVTDEPQYIDYDHMARVANLVEDVALHVANLDHRIVVDQPKPDPRGTCRQ
ncbi:MAG: M28 family peptidase [Gemmatimonadaceae bacterium]|nr:M28 family peptidase [Gemmatimonadaceae bacterium]